MIIFVDSNIILDVMLPNPQFYDESYAVLSSSLHGYDLYISAASITDIFYVARKSFDSSEKTKEAILNLLKVVSVAGVDESCIYNALNSDWKDFEDSVQHQIAQQINADLIVTRNSSDYSHSSVRIMSPKEYLAFISE